VFDDPELEAFMRAQADAILADLGYEPLREIPWSDPLPTQERFRDVELESDISRLRNNQADLLARLRGLAPETDSFSLPVSGDFTALTFNEVLVDAQRFLLQGADRIATAAQRYRNIANETPSTGSRLAPEDLAYAQHELTRRKELGEHLLAYCRDPAGTSLPPRKPSGEVISPVLAGGLAQKYAMDALELHQRLNHLEPTLTFVNQVEDDFNRFAGTMGAHGSEYLKALAAKLEDVRKKGMRWRRAAVTTLSVFLLLAGVFVDKALSQTFGDLLWLSIAAVAVMWIYDRAISTIVEKETRKQRLRIVMDAIDSVADWLIFLREQQEQLNVLRTSTDRPIVQLADDWC
jgi:hypothetical protein